MPKFASAIARWLRSIGTRPGAEKVLPSQVSDDITTAAAKPRSRVIPIHTTSDSATGFQCPPSCWGTCCDDTVFLQAQDVTTIHEFANRHYDRFVAHFAKVWVWAGLPNQKIVVTPAHFTNADGTAFAFFRDASTSELVAHTRQGSQRSSSGEPYYHTLLSYDLKSETAGGCVFLTERKSCFLEDVALEVGEHPWEVKPEGCVSFPLVVGPDSVMVPLRSPQHDDPRSPKHELLNKFADKACCTSVLPTNYSVRMRHVLEYLPAARKRRQARHTQWVSQHRSAFDKHGLLATFWKPPQRRAGTSASTPRRPGR
jgi:hypothetical protein